LWSGRAFASRETLNGGIQFSFVPQRFIQPFNKRRKYHPYVVSSFKALLVSVSMQAC
jgi:hypothetical protein